MTMTGTDLLTAALGTSEDEARHRLLARLRRYVEHETPSGDEAGLTALAAVIAAELEALGAHIDRFPAPGLGVNLLASVPGVDGDAAPLVVLAHIDTVHPHGSLAARPFEIRADRAVGPGIYDMKCGLALVVEALALLRARGGRPARPLRLLVTCDEEIGSHSSRPHIEALARIAGSVLVPEPAIEGGGVKTARKGVATYALRVTGRAAHAGIEPGTAVSAIAEIAHQIIASLACADHARGTTINIGTIEGGTASNVVPARAAATIDVRAVAEPEMARVHEALTTLRPQLSGAQVIVERTELRPPLERTPAVVALYERVRELARSLGHELGEGASGGGSDGSIAASLGAPTLDGIGADGGGAHADHEYVLLGDLPFRLALWTRVLETL